MTTKKTKAKRELSNITFEHEGAHVALTSKSQGGPANGKDYALVLKSSGYSQEAIEKMQQVQVTLELPEFLRRFFDMYYTDSEVLARMMGYVPEESDDEYGSEAYYAERMEAFTVMKSLHESGDVLKALALLDENEYLSLLNTQVQVEKALAELDAEKESDPAATVVESDNSTNASVEKSVEPSGSKVKSKKEKMTTKTEKTADATVEMVEKSVVESIQKALEAKEVELQKALEAVAAFEQAQKEAVVKSKTAQITALVADESIQSAVVKAALALEAEEDFTAFVTAIQKMAETIKSKQEIVDKSALFAEQGASTSDTVEDQEGPVARILKARVNKAK